MHANGRFKWLNKDLNALLLEAPRLQEMEGYSEDVQFNESYAIQGSSGIDGMPCQEQEGKGGRCCSDTVAKSAIYG
jgi:hypothetical protein